MSQIKSVGKMVATGLIGEIAQVAVARKAGIATIDDRVFLHALKVLFKSDSFEAGDVVYIDGVSAINHPWSKNQYTIDGVTFILVPEEFVVLVKQAPPPPVRPTAL